MQSISITLLLASKVQRPTPQCTTSIAIVPRTRQSQSCVSQVIGKPSPSVWWTYSAEMPEENAKFNRSEALSSQGRFKLAPNEQGVEDAVLEIAAAERADAGVYVCHADAGAHAHRDHTTLRVKDMYAALWPFLGICAEVFVLCAIILVYEKRRTKPELDDSDTDNHDQ